MTGPVLVPLTLGAANDHKLAVVEQHAKALDTNVVLLHVLPGGQPLPEHGLVPAEEAHARTHLDTLALALRARGVPARSLVRRGRLSRSVGQTAAEHSAALIVVGRSAPRGVLRRLASRGPAEQIARAAPCPVLVVDSESSPTGQTSGSSARAGTSPNRAATALRRFDADAARCGPLAPYVLGTRTVELSRVVGSVPALHLRRDFRLHTSREADTERHDRLTRLMAERPEQLTPPDLYKLGYGYYVFTGHAQVAAAHAAGQAWIDATVTEYVPLNDAEARQIVDERATFERQTGLTGIGAAVPGTYAHLRALIDDYRGEDELRLAATRWKAAIFRPLQRRLRALRLNQRFPGERSADIAVRIAAHRRHLSALRRDPIYWDEALTSFADLLTHTHTGRAA